MKEVGNGGMERISILNLKISMAVDKFWSSISMSLQFDMTSMERGLSENYASKKLSKSGLKNIKSTKLLNMV